MTIAPVSPAPAPASAAPASAPTAAPAASQAAPTPFEASLSQLKSADPTARVAVDPTTNVASFYSGALNVHPTGKIADRPDAVAAAFLNQEGLVFGISKPATNLKLVASDTDQLGMQHDKYQQTYKGLPVFGQQIIVHSKGETVHSAAGDLTPNITVSTDPTIGKHAAFTHVRRSLGDTVGKGIDGQLVDQKLGIYTGPNGAAHLAYQIDVASGRYGDPSSWRYFVDAKTGATLKHVSQLETALDRETYDTHNSTQQPGTLERSEGQGPVKDPVVNEAHTNAKAVYDYYESNFGRDSIDGKGMPIISTVHYGKNYDNAFWDGKQMTYGDGDGKEFTNFANGLDVVGHEMTHGVTEHTAGLNYYGQTGALNESWSDVMGELIQRSAFAKAHPGAPDPDPNYDMGEDIFTPGTPGDALRSMKNPGHAYPGDNQPADMAHYVNTYSDNGGVHTNSGIPNHAAYLVTKKVGDNDLGQIWYRALTHYLTPNAKFSDAANATVQSAVDLYGKQSSEANAVRDAWKGVGLAPTA